MKITIRLVIILSSGLALPAYGATLLSENYEVNSVSDLTSKGWEVMNNVDIDGSPTLAIVAAPSGRTGSVLRMQYQGVHDLPNGTSDDSHNAKITKFFNGSPEIYTRYYVRYDAINPAQPTGFSGTGKQHYYNVSELPDFVLDYMWNDPNLMFVNQSNVMHTCPNGEVGITCNLYAQVAKPVTNGIWRCVETHLSQTVAEIWIDGTLTLSSTMILAPATYHSLQVYRQGSDNMYRYEDDLIISTTRVGCSESPVPSDVQAPSVPANLSAQAASSFQINLSWTASADNVGVAGYKIFRGGAQIATTAGTSYSNTGLSPATAYSYTVAAYDAAGNTSAQSSAASAATSPPPLATDTTPPAVSMTAPASGATVSGGAVSVTANADDTGPAGETPSGVAGVKFLIDGNLIGTEDTAMPYSASLNTALYSNGAHTLTAVARDVVGHMTTSAARTITISNVAIAPVGSVANLSATATGADSATLSFTEADDGTGQPAKYDIRYQSPAISWGSAASVAQGTCASPLLGTQINAIKTCTVTGLAASTQYQFQLVPFRGTMNVDAVFGPLSNVASATTSAGTPAVTCDANNDGSTNVVDVQLSVNQALGVSSCASDINQDGSCNVVDVQRTVNAALGGACGTGP